MTDVGPLSTEALDSNPDQLVVFDVDGTLIQSIGIDDRCFTQAVSDVLGVEEISTDWAGYQYQTDSGLIFEIASRHFGVPPTDQLASRVRDHFVQLLDRESAEPGFVLAEVQGASAVLNILRHHPNWCAAIATGGWEAAAKLKLGRAKVSVDGLPFASSDDAMAREDIIECAIARAQQIHGRNAFKKVVYVGDGSWDAVAAGRLGIGFIAVTEVAAAAFEFGHAPIAKDFAATVEFIRQLDSVTTQCR